MWFENFTFDLQRFKGNTTVENKYEPTEYELEGQKIAAQYAGSVAPNALLLNNYAAQILPNTFLNVINDADLTYKNLWGTALTRQNGALDDMSYQRGLVNQAVNNNLSNLSTLPSAYQGVANTGASQQNRLAGDVGNALSTNRGVMDSIYNQYSGATDNMSANINRGIDANNAATNAAERVNQGYINGNNNAYNRVANAYDTATGRNLAAENTANSNLEGYRQLGNTATNTTNQNLLGYIPQNDAANQSANGLLGGYMNSGSSATQNANADLSKLRTNNQIAYTGVDKSLSDLQNGTIPQAYQDAMAKSIESAMTKTIGNTMNNLGQRGVLNSSVTTSAMNDIAKNAADVTAQNYLNNINTLQGLAQNKFSDAITTDRENAAMIQQQLGNSQSNIDRNVGIAQQMRDNTLGVNQINAGLNQTALGNTMNNIQYGTNNVNTQFSNSRNVTDANAGYAQQKYADARDTTNANFGISNTSYQNRMNNNATNLNANQQDYTNRANLYNTGFNNAQQLFNNALNTANAQSGYYNLGTGYQNSALNSQSQIYNNMLQNALLGGNYALNADQAILGNSGLPISTTAAGQEAALAPMFNLWNASLGLNGSSTGALAGIAGGKGTSTSTQSNGGGGFLSGLFGGIF